MGKRIVQFGVKEWRKLVRFGMVGTLCLAVQLALLQLFKLWLHPTAADAIAFMLSAQLNFVLSYAFTWHDSDRKSGRQLWVTWLQFNSVVLLAAVVNAVFYHISRSILPDWDIVNVIVAGAFSTVFTFTVNNLFIFQQKSGKVPIMLRTPSSAQPPGIAFFLPAWNEAENLPFVVGEAVAHLHTLPGPFQVIIIDDGSTDNTFEVGVALEMAYPGNVRLVQHDQNKGYGGALRTGFQEALQTGYGWIAFCDADGQFKPHEVSRLIDEANNKSADIAIGYRIARADNLKRRLMGRAWHLLSRYILGYEAVDVDCGFKLFNRDSLQYLVPQLTGEHATISPEILTRAHLAGHSIVQIGVNHYPRQHGKQSGSNLRVIRESLQGLVRIRRNILQERERENA